MCAGYAEIVRNTLACFGIDATFVGGYTEVDTNNPNEKTKGHAWNQVKLDGQWYNMDLTWTREYIVECGMPIHLLLSDKDFEAGEKHEFFGKSYFFPGHEKYSKSRGTLHSCDETFPYDKLKEYFDMDYHSEKLQESFEKRDSEVSKGNKQDWLKQSCKRLFRSSVEKVGAFLNQLFNPKFMDNNKEERV